MKPLVSILIPCYNAEEVIAETLRSCLEQTYENIEIIVVDDGSTDDSFAVAKQFESDKVKVVRQKNSGACRARNYAFELSHGDLIQFIDADDLLSPGKITSQVEAYISSGDPIAIITCPWRRFMFQPYDGQKEFQCCFNNFDNGLTLLLTLLKSGSMFIPGCYLLSRRVAEAAGNWDEKIKLNQDGEFFARVLLHAGKVIFVPHETVFYRSSSATSITKTISPAKIESAFYALQQIKKNLLACNNTCESRLALATAFTDLSCSAEAHCYKTAMTAIDEIKKLGMAPQLHGNTFTMKLAKIIGLKNCLRIKALCRKLKLR